MRDTIQEASPPAATAALVEVWTSARSGPQWRVRALTTTTSAELARAREIVLAEWEHLSRALLQEGRSTS